MGVLLENGQQPIVTFKKSPWDDSYLEPNMRARLAFFEMMQATVKVVFDFSDFVEYNKKYERPDYYDDKQNPCLTATEANMVPANHRETVYFDPDEDDTDDIFTICPQSEERQELLDDYKEVHPDCSYTEWLERRVIQHNRDLDTIYKEILGLRNDLIARGVLPKPVPTE